MAAVTICSDFGANENKICHCFCCFPSICHEVMGQDVMILVFWMNPHERELWTLSSIRVQYMQIHLTDKEHPKETELYREKASTLEKITTNGVGRESPVSAEFWESEGLGEWFWVLPTDRRWPFTSTLTRFSSVLESWVRRNYYENERAILLVAQPTFLWDLRPKILHEN